MEGDKNDLRLNPKGSPYPRELSSQVSVHSSDIDSPSEDSSLSSEQQ